MGKAIKSDVWFEFHFFLALESKITQSVSNYNNI